MATTRQPKNAYRLARTPKDRAALHERAAVIRQIDPQHPLVVANPALLAIIAAIAKADDEATQAADEATVADEVAAAKHETTETKTTVLSNQIDFFDAHVQIIAPTSEQAKSLGGKVLTKASYPLVAPINVKVRYDAKKKLWIVEVQRADGLKVCVVQWTGTPADEASWKTIGGEGATRELADLLPGIYWVRVAHARGRKQSPFTEPTSFTVK